MKIGIIGVGFVGGATAEVFREKYNVALYDKYKEEYNQPLALIDSDIIFICVPTPAKSTGEIDISMIEDSLILLEKLTKGKKEKPLVVIRSTSVPGTAEKLSKKYFFHIASNPEFLREKHSIEDMKNTRRIVIGAGDEKDKEKLISTYKSLFPDAVYICTDTKTSEMIKYAANAMLIGQIGLANEIYKICESLKIDYNDIKEALLLDQRIARNIDVPGHDGKFGFGGKCFPKDLKAIIFLSKQKGHNPGLFQEIWRLNERVRKNKDWLKIPGATSDNLNFS